MTTRETVLAALFVKLQTIGGGVQVKRNIVAPEALPAAGLVILHDGDPNLAETYLSPLTYAWEHRAEIEAIVAAATPALAATALDALVVSVRTAIYADRTLGGLVDHLEALAPDVLDLEVEGASDLKGALIPVLLHYDTPDPLT